MKLLIENYLVIAEDDITIRPKNLDELFNDVRKIHYKSYIRYFYFNLGSYNLSSSKCSVSLCFFGSSNSCWRCDIRGNATNYKSFW